MNTKPYCYVQSSSTCRAAQERKKLVVSSLPNAPAAASPSNAAFSVSSAVIRCLASPRSIPRLFIVEAGNSFGLFGDFTGVWA